ncbi:DUF177 domain-containing protein [Ascidiaceihabitans sp.]|uniref:YceD family protein n=1 Tax=Ascidiaceihabitans sp. TaxID=1872644 RepID=UPI003298F84D
MCSQIASPTAYRVADLPQRAPKPFDLRPNADAMSEIAAQLDLTSLRKLRFFGSIRAVGKVDWQLKGTLGATVVQPCTVTLDPVTTRIDTPVERMFLKSIPEVNEEEVEMPDDDGIELLGAFIDPADVMIEALSLAVPDYPRAPDAALSNTVFTKPGEAAMTDADARPFAGLAALKDKMEDKPD